MVNRSIVPKIDWRPSQVGGKARRKLPETTRLAAARAGSRGTQRRSSASSPWARLTDDLRALEHDGTFESGAQFIVGSGAVRH
jgi:hypothetical protein